MRLVRCPACGVLRDPKDGRCGDCGRSLLLATRSPRAMSPEEYMEAVSSDELDLSRVILLVGGFTSVVLHRLA